MSFSLPFDPFLLLEPASVHRHDHELEIWNGGGNTKEVTLVEEDKPDITIVRSSQALYFDLNGVPTAFAFKPFNISYEPDESCYSTLKDNGLTAAWDCQEDSDGLGQTNYFDTYAVAKRKDVSDLPITLVNLTYENEDNLYEDDYYRGPYNEPFVIYYEKSDEVPGWANDGGYIPKNAASYNVFEKAREYITEDNNDYYEGVFQYDINGDNEIPAYVPAEYPPFSEQLDTINGKTKIGTEDNDTLKGKKKNDLLDGKEGNDVLTGKRGEDLLYGKQGFDQLYGSTGNDFLNGGADDDILEGGSGSDIFKLSDGRDTVTDFNINESDQIAIPVDYANSFTINQSGTSTIIAAQDYGQLELLNTSIDDIAEANASIFLRYA